MTSLRLLLSLTSCLTAATAQSRPSPVWLPIEVGCYWDYDSAVGLRVSYECVERVREDGVDWFVVARNDGTFTSRERWSLQKDGRRRRREPAAKKAGAAPVAIPAAEHVLEVAPGVSAFWAWDAERRAELAAVDEVVDVPAGRFECARVVHPGGTLWIARGVGVVKSSEDGAAGAGAPLVLSLRAHGAPGGPPSSRLAKLARETLAADPRGRPVRLELVRAAGEGPRLRSQFFRAFWEQGSELFREDRGRIVAFDPRDPAQWNSLLAEEGLGSARGLRVVANLAAAQIASENCARFQLMDSSDRRDPRSAIVIPAGRVVRGTGGVEGGIQVLEGELLQRTARSVLGTTRAGKPYSLSVEVSFAAGEITAVRASAK